MNDISQMADQLNAANMATLTLQPINENAHQLVCELAETTVEYLLKTGGRKRRHKADVYECFLKTVGAVVGDLLFNACNQEAGGFCYRSFNKDEFGGTLATSRHFEEVIKAWEQIGFIEVRKGYSHTDDFDGQSYRPNTRPMRRATRLRATEKLQTLCHKHKVAAQTANLSFGRVKEKTIPVRLKSSKAKNAGQAKDMTLPQSEKLRRLQHEVSEINEFLSVQTFSFGPLPYLYRVFNNGDLPDFQWDQGGRFYTSGTSYLNATKETRRNIKINGDPVCEIDVVACQLTLLHGMTKTELTNRSDPYQIAGIEREAVKERVNVWIGKGAAPDLESLLTKNSKKSRNDALILQALPVLGAIEAKGLNSYKLQSVESNIVAATLLELLRYFEVPALPVHDCLIVRRVDKELACDVFLSQFERLAGIRPELS